MSGQDRAEKAKKPLKFDLRLSDVDRERLAWLVDPANDPTARGESGSALIRRLIAEEYDRRLRLLARHRRSHLTERVTASLQRKIEEEIAADERPFIEP
ncbi:MAG: hypothetical protein HYV09_26590 [Deltaproteobacteria bacterium]|nr:hypothetical protein [Deltaproteobacteria bacterium]